jgi:hypothetical protein
MDKCSLFYWSREYTKHIDVGEDYMTLSNVIAINILDAEFLSLDAVHASFQLKERDIEYNALHRWLTFFDKKPIAKQLQNNTNGCINKKSAG